MKKIIQVVSFAFIALVFSAAAANAQSVRKFQAEIPFTFSLGGHNYEPGKYSLKVTRSFNGAGFLTLMDNRGRNLQILTVSQTGGSSRVAELEFIRTGDQQSLSRITTEDNNFVVHNLSKKRADVAGNIVKIPVAGSLD